jgi:hypothetical protein
VATFRGSGTWTIGAAAIVFLPFGMYSSGSGSESKVWASLDGRRQ